MTSQHAAGAAHAAGPASADGAHHPLDPLTGDEIRQAVSILAGDGRVGPALRFVSVGLHEPAKEEVAAFGPGQGFDRKAFIVAREPREHMTYEAVVSITAGAVLSWQPVPGAQTPVTLGEYAECERLVRADPRFRAGLRKRGIHDPDQVLVEAWGIGTFAREADAGRRLVWALCARCGTTRRRRNQRYLNGPHVRKPTDHDGMPPQAGLPGRVINVHRRQVPHVVLGEVEPDTVLGPGDGADRDGYLLAPPQVPLLEQHVGHVVVAQVDDEPFHVADLAVGGMGAIAAAHLHLAQRNGVVGDGLRDPGDYVPFDPGGPAQAQPWLGEHLFRAVGRIAPGPRHELRLLGGVELLKLRHRATQPDLAVGGVGKVEGHEPAEPATARRFHHEVGEFTVDRVDDHPGHLATFLA